MWEKRENIQKHRKFTCMLEKWKKKWEKKEIYKKGTRERSTSEKFNSLQAGEVGESPLEFSKICIIL